MNDAASLILVIDDDPQNLKLLNRTLSEAHYRVALANSGQVALDSLERRRPDLILCDIVMPGMDGYEVCRRLKANPDYSDIPLVFLTSRTETKDLLEGFLAGAVDYVTKPFSQAEVLARVRTHTELKRARDTILENNQQLQALNRHLATLNEEKNHFLAVAAHDLKNPLTTVLMRAEMAEECLENPDAPDISGVQTFLTKIQEDVNSMRQIVTNLLDINQIEAGSLAVQSQPFQLTLLAEQLVERYQAQATRKQIKLSLELPDQPIELVSDPHLVYQLADNLLSNAIKYSYPDSEVALTLRSDQTCAELEIRDQGPGFSEADKSRMFQKFTPLSARPTAGESSTGLGLSIVSMLVNLLKARLSCESAPGDGTRFQIWLPLDPAQDQFLG